MLVLVIACLRMLFAASALARAAAKAMECNCGAAVRLVTAMGCAAPTLACVSGMDSVRVIVVSVSAFAIVVRTISCHIVVPAEGATHFAVGGMFQASTVGIGAATGM